MWVLDFRYRTTGSLNGSLGSSRECVGFDSDFVGYCAVGEDFHKLTAVDEAGLTELFDTDFFKALGSGELVESADVDGLVLNTVDVLEAETWGRRRWRGIWPPSKPILRE